MYEKVVHAQEWYTPTSFVNAQDWVDFSIQLQPHGRAKRSTQHICSSDRQNRKVEWIETLSRMFNPHKDPPRISLRM